MEERLERMEEMLANLIRMVGDMKNELSEVKQEQKVMKLDLTEVKQEQKAMKQDLTEVKQEQKATREDLTQMRKENDKHFNEMNNRFVSIEMDHEHTWQKSVQNEREISKLKKQFDLIDY